MLWDFVCSPVAQDVEAFGIFNLMDLFKKAYLHQSLCKRNIYGGEDYIVLPTQADKCINTWSLFNKVAQPLASIESL